MLDAAFRAWRRPTRRAWASCGRRRRPRPRARRSSRAGRPRSRCGVSPGRPRRSTCGATLVSAECPRRGRGGFYRSRRYLKTSPLERRMPSLARRPLQRSTRHPRRSLPEPTLSVDLSSRAHPRPLVVPSDDPRPRRSVSTEYPRRGRGGVESRAHTSQRRFRPRATDCRGRSGSASPRSVSTEYPRRGHGGVERRARGISARRKRPALLGSLASFCCFRRAFGLLRSAALLALRGRRFRAARAQQPCIGQHKPLAFEQPLGRSVSRLATSRPLSYRSSAGGSSRPSLGDRSLAGLVRTARGIPPGDRLRHGIRRNNRASAMHRDEFGGFDECLRARPASRESVRLRDALPCGYLRAGLLRRFRANTHQ